MPTKKKAPPRPKAELDYIAPELRSIAVPLKDLTPDPKNVRKHGDRNMEAITASLRRFGVRQPIVVQKSGADLIVRAGNGRMAAALHLGWTHLPAVVFEENDTDAVAYAIADNRTAELAEWDWESLSATLKEVDGDWTNLGWADYELEPLMEAIWTPPEPSGVSGTSFAAADSKPDAAGVGVVVRACHTCCEHRGVKTRTEMLTSKLLGAFRDPAVRAEFLALTR